MSAPTETPASQQESENLADAMEGCSPQQGPTDQFQVEQETPAATSDVQPISSTSHAQSNTETAPMNFSTPGTESEEQAVHAAKANEAESERESDASEEAKSARRPQSAEPVVSRNSKSHNASENAESMQTGSAPDGTSAAFATTASLSEEKEKSPNVLAIDSDAPNAAERMSDIENATEGKGERKESVELPSKDAPASTEHSQNVCENSQGDAPILSSKPEQSDENEKSCDRADVVKGASKELGNGQSSSEGYALGDKAKSSETDRQAQGTYVLANASPSEDLRDVEDTAKPLEGSQKSKENQLDMAGAAIDSETPTRFVASIPDRTLSAPTVTEKEPLINGKPLPDERNLPDSAGVGTSANMPALPHKSSKPAVDEDTPMPDFVALSADPETGGAIASIPSSQTFAGARPPQVQAQPQAATHSELKGASEGASQSAPRVSPAVPLDGAGEPPAALDPHVAVSAPTVMMANPPVPRLQPVRLTPEQVNERLEELELSQMRISNQPLAFPEESPTHHRLRALLGNFKALTQTFIAHTTQLSQSILSNYMRGRLPRHKAEEVQNVLEGFIDEFVRGRHDTALAHFRPPTRVPGAPGDISNGSLNGNGHIPVAPSRRGRGRGKPRGRSSIASYPEQQSLPPLPPPHPNSHQVPPPPPAPQPPVAPAPSAQYVAPPQLTRPRQYAAPLVQAVTELSPCVAVERAFHAYLSSTWASDYLGAEPLLLPLELFVEIDGRELHVFTQWDVNEKFASPETVSDTICNSRNFPLTFAPPLASQIRRRLFEAGVSCAPPPKEAPGEIRRLIKIAVELKEGGRTRILTDEFEWDLCMGEFNSAELFAQHLCADAGISQSHVPKVAQAIRCELSRAQALSFGDEDTKALALRDLEPDHHLRRPLPVVKSAIKRMSPEEIRAKQRLENEVQISNMFVKPLLAAVDREHRKRAADRERLKAEEEKRLHEIKKREEAIAEAERRRAAAKRALLEVDANVHKVKMEHGINIRPYLDVRLGRGSIPGLWLEGLLERKRKGIPILPEQEDLAPALEPKRAKKRRTSSTPGRVGRPPSRPLSKRIPVGPAKTISKTPSKAASKISSKTSSKMSSRTPVRSSSRSASKSSRTPVEATEAPESTRLRSRRLSTTAAPSDKRRRVSARLESQNSASEGPVLRRRGK